LSLGFTLFILFNVVRTLWMTGKLFFQAVPDKTLHNEIRHTLLEIHGIHDIHHQHLWSLDGEHHVLSAHIVVDEAFHLEEYLMVKDAISEALKPFQLAHTTIEIELNHENCRDFPGNHEKSLTHHT
jgi:cobalt-zinc-cadmium efflux system protein